MTTIITIFQVLVVITFISSAAAARALSAPRTEIRFIEDLRFDTRSPVGWILLLTLLSIPFLSILLAIRFLNIKIIVEHFKLFLVIVNP